ncbi:type VI secretion system baseplate subunit TssG [Sapientia aquatica]|uniref:Type VI secretion system baseplate subunit TssG n=1 Tax=Sapientia aquatica TaxID=1549640 RepID=A0A4R5VTJ2_9BURK|nr:type VI secretion system baseplate subunit TssG [Sapientia aquatica]TDK61301.1 type VI secretion system baseplate subunit TssG [Sapientia aquatica]
MKKSLDLNRSAAIAQKHFNYQLLTDQPWKYSFTSLLRFIAARCRRTMPPIGSAFRPQDEPFRLGQQPALTFAPREIAHILVRESRLHINLFSLGMLGPNGPLPIHFTEIAKDRLDNRHDSTLVNFLNIFHHRSMVLQYRAWAQSQSAAGLDRSEEENFSRYISWLTGNDPWDIPLSPLPAHARLATAPHLAKQSRNPFGLCATLGQYFDVPVDLEENILHWISISPDEHTRLGISSEASTLSNGALLGDMVPDKQHKFRLVIGPLSLEEYLRFTPSGENLSILVEWVRAFIGLEFAWDIELKIKPESAPAARIGDNERLGWSTWLSNDRLNEPITGMIFEPETYVANEREKHVNKN